MSLPKREFARPSSLPIAVDELYGIMRLRAFNAAGFPTNILAENDGTLRSQLLLYDGSTQRRMLSETDGTAKSSLYGKNSSAVLKSLRVNANDQLQVEIIEGSHVQVDPVLIPNVEGLLWNPGTTSASLYKVMFKIVNSTATDVTGVNIGQDIGAGGSLSAAEYWEQGLIIPGNGHSGWLGPHLIPGDDRVRGVAGTNNVLGIHWLIKQVA